MTTTTDVADSVRLSSADFDWRRTLIAFVLTMLVLLFFAGAFAVGYARLHDGRLLPGVAIGGVSVGGLTAAQAEAKLRQSLPDITDGQLNVTIGTETTAISYADLGREYQLEAMVDQAFGVGHAGAPFDQLSDQLGTLLNGVEVPLSATWDADLLAQRIAQIVGGAESEHVDAVINRVDGDYVVTPSVEGVAVDEDDALRQAMAALDNSSPADTEISLATEAIQPKVTTEQAQAAADRANNVAAQPLRLTAMGTSATVEADTIKGWTRLEQTAVGEWQVIVEDAPIIQLVDELKFQLYVPATNATYTFEARNPVVVPEAEGREIDREQAIAAVTEELNSRMDNGPSGSTLNLAITPLVPDFTSSEAEALIDRIERLASWTTRYDSSSRNGFGQNIRRPTNLIDGAVIAPGEEFDFVELAGPITAGNGYTSGAAIIHGNTRLDGVLGGGLCSCSTTIFNAALRAGLEMGARRNHAYYIDRYPVGLDATIWISGSYVQTMTFTNDTDYPILIRGINREGSVTFRIYGVPDGRKVRFSQPRISNEKQAWTRFEYTTDLPAGKTERVEYPFRGFQSVVTRTVTDANGAILHEDTYRSNYRRVVGHVLVGWAPGDPPPGTILEPNKPAGQ